MAAWRYEISLLVLKKYFTRSLRSPVKYFSTLEEKFRISARPCNILYVILSALDIYVCPLVTGTPNENIVQNHLNIALLDVF